MTSTTNSHEAGGSRASGDARRWFLLAAIVASGMLFQLLSVPGTSPDYDKAHNLAVARRFVEGGVFPEHGSRNSLMAYNAPMFPWLFVPPMWVTDDVSWILTFPALMLHLIALLLTFRLGNRIFGHRVGTLAVALYAFSIQGLYFGHSSWQQGILAPLYVTIVYSLFRWHIDNREWHASIALALCAFTTGIHWGGLISYAAPGTIVVLRRRKLRFGPLFLGGVLSLALWAPYLRFEWDRRFIDIRAALLQAPLRAPAPHEVSPLCPVPKENDDSVGLRHALKERLGSHPVIYEATRRAYHTVRGTPGLVRALYANFHWDPFHGSKAPIDYHAIFFLESLVFVLGLVLLAGKFFQDRLSNPEKLLLLVFALPAVFQNLSGHASSSLTRPDVSWLFYGPQVLLLAHVIVHAAPPSIPWFRRGFHLLVGAWIVWTMVKTVQSYEENMETGGTRGRLAVVSAIAEDLGRDGKHQAAIRYEFLPEAPEWCWIVSFGALDPDYSLGAEYNYLLESVHGIENTSRVPDGMVLDPDYVVLFPAGLARYDLRNGGYRKLTDDRAMMQVIRVMK